MLKFEGCKPPMPDENEPTDCAALIRAGSTGYPTPPEWLNQGLFVKSRQYGVGKVVSLLGARLVLSFPKGSNTLHQLLNWETAISTGEIVPAGELTPPAKTLNEEILKIPEQRFRAVAEELSESIAAVEITPATDSEKHPLPNNLPLGLRTALNRTGIASFYSHQIEALECLRSGKDLCLATPTASGKTLCYNPAIFEFALANPRATALYIFPLKALALDQFGKLQNLAAALPPAQQVKVGMMTGDTSIEERKRLFVPHPPQILGLTPDLLHHQLYKVQQQHEGEPWREFLRNLKWVIIDEAHTYFGAFGAHIANLMRRLRRAADRAGGCSNSIQFIFASATTGNPREMAPRFSGRESERVHLISRSGAGDKGRTLLCLKPSDTANPDAGKTVISWLRNELTGIVFCNSRSAVKSLLEVIHNNLQGEEHLARKVALFHGSLKDERRRDIIQQISSGKIQVILSTSALEAGIDLPELDCCLIRGFPGSIMSFWQRVGRVGRQNPGLVIFLPVAQSALDCYYGKYPEKLLRGDVESVSFNPDYPTILGKHLLCACVESGVPVGELSERFGNFAGNIAGELLQQNKISLSQSGNLWARGYPHREVNLRGAAQDSIELTDKRSGEEFEKMSRHIAYREVFPGAIYTAQDERGNLVKYRSETLDTELGKATLVPYSQNPGLLTEAVSDTDITPLHPLAEPKIIPTGIPDGRLRLTLSWGKIITSVTGYKLYSKEWAKTCTNSSCMMYRQPVSSKFCPFCYRLTRQAEIETEKRLVSFEEPLQTVCEAPVVSVEINLAIFQAIRNQLNSVKQSIRKAGPGSIPDELEDLWQSSPEFIALHSIEHQITFALPMLVFSSSHDLSGAVLSSGEGQTLSVAGYFFDTCEGGNGAAEAVFNQFVKLAAKAQSLAKACDCESGCPRCLLQHGCPHQNKGLHKKLGLFLLDAICQGN